jgi:phosphoribosylformimino-5-aminoimidazole carboxamide ribotide isomerase
MYFRPCIDLHEGKVKQIVGSTLRDNKSPKTNFIADMPASYFAKKYQSDNLSGGHVIMLGPNNVEAALEAIKTYPRGLQIGGGINLENAQEWLDAGASHLIVTSFVFHDGQIDWLNLKKLSSTVGREHLVLDLSCRKENSFFRIMTERWQSPTEVTITNETLEKLAEYCSEFLIHATDVEGKQQGINSELVRLLGECTPIPTTYAGGVRSQRDIDQIGKLGLGKIDFTVGSALDIFGGKTLRYDDLASQYHPTKK